MFYFKKLVVQKKSILALLAIAVLFLWELNNNFPINILSWDVYGAYLHLPANFIYSDPFLTDWSWIEGMNEQYNSTPSYYQFWYADTGNQVIKYPLGFALIYMPFFFLGHVAAFLFGQPMDGFSNPYQLAIIFGHCFYVLLGIWMTRKVILCFFSEATTAILLLLLFVGTNFYFTCTTMVAMPHGHLFLFYALILWFTIRWHEQPNTKNSVLLGLSIGLAALIRATEVLTVLIPLLWKVTNRVTWQEKWIQIKAERNKIWLIGFVLFLVGAIQLIYYKLATGNFFIDAYNNAGEGFDLFEPHTIDFLFSARKGWLVYTPLMIFSFWGFWIMKKQRHHAFLALFVFTFFNIYLLSSWTCWWYAESFGQRALVQSYLVLLIPFGFLIEFLLKQKRLMKVTVFLIMGLFVALNLFQTWQLQHGLIHPSRMTSDAYWAHFLKTSPITEFNDLLLVDKNVPAGERLKIQGSQLNVAARFRYVYGKNGWEAIDLKKKQALKGAQVSNDNVYSKDLVLKYPEVTNKKNVIFRLEAKILFEGDVKEIQPILVFKMRHRGKGYYDQYLHIDALDSLVSNCWQDINQTFYSADVRDRKKNEIQIFAWLAGQGNFKVDDIRLTVFEGLR